MVDLSVSRLERLLGPARPIDRMPAGAVQQLDEEFQAKTLHAEVSILARAFAVTQATGASSSECRLAWHHLLMTVANLRSRSGTLRLGGEQCYLDEIAGTSLDSFEVPAPASGPGARICVQRHDPCTWPLLTDSVPGLTVPTASSVLAALWPDDHASLDNITIGTLIGLQAMDEYGQPHENITLEGLNNIWRDAVTGTKTWADYEWFVGTLRATVESPAFRAAGVRLEAVERAVSLVGSRAAGYSASQWPEWATRLNDTVRLANEAWSAA